MFLLWLLLGTGLGGAIAWSVSSQKHQASRLEYLVDSSLNLLENGTIKNYMLVRNKLARAARIKQDDLKVWAGYSLAEARMQWEYFIPLDPHNEYKNAGLSLITKGGYKYLTNSAEPLWQESEFLHKLLQTSGGNKHLMYKVKKFVGFYPQSSGLRSVLSHLYAKFGYYKKAVKLLHQPQTNTELLAKAQLSLELGKTKNALEDANTIIKRTPEHLLARLIVKNSKTPYEYEDISWLKSLQKHRALNVSSFATCLLVKDYFLKNKRRKALASLKKIKKTNISYLLMSLIDYYLKLSKMEEAEKQLNNLFKYRERSNWKVKNIQAELRFSQGNPLLAWKSIKDLPPEKISEYSSGIYYFSDSARVKQEFKNKFSLQKDKYQLPDDFSKLDKSDQVSKLGWLWNNRKLINQQQIKYLENKFYSSQFNFYAGIILGYYYLDQARLIGEGRAKFQDLIQKTEEILDKLPTKPVLAMRLRYKVLYYKNKNAKALEIVRKICNKDLASKNTKRVCPSSFASVSDRRFLLNLLTIPADPEKDLEYAISRSLKLIPKVVQSKEEMIYWKARVAMQQIRLLPGNAANIAGKAVAGIKAPEAKSPDVAMALAPLYAILGKIELVMKLWNKNSERHLVENLRLAKLLLRIGVAPKALKIVETVLDKSDILAKYRIKALVLKGKCLNRMNRNGNKHLSRAWKRESSPATFAAYLEGLLEQIDQGRNHKKNCSLLKQLFEKDKKLNAQELYLKIKYISKCDSESKNASEEISNLLNKIPENSIFYSKAILIKQKLKSSP
ncbi:MAG: tetratricopeptide repeat protein [Myxococcota bacterium]